MASVDFCILGPLEVRHDGGLVELAGARQRALLAVLLLHAGEVVSGDRLLDEVWGDDVPTAGVAALRVRISQLRRALGPAAELLLTRAPGYVLRLAPDQLDLQRFERLVEDGERALADGDPGTADAVLREALELWQGQPLADLGDAPFAAAARVRLEEIRLAAIELRNDAGLALGRHARLAGELRSLVSQHPLRERLWAQLMVALCRDGRQADALDAYRQARSRLVDELGLEPGRALQELEARVLAQDPSLSQSQSPPMAAPICARTILVLAGVGPAAAALTALISPLTADAGKELILARLVGTGVDLAAATEALNELRAAAVQRAPSGSIRVAAFTSPDRAADALRLVDDHDVALLVSDLPDPLPAGGSFGVELGALLERAVCDVALIAGAERTAARGGPVLVPFSGSPHDWAAAELAAGIAGSAGVPLRLLGTGADQAGRGRDASRLLASASLALQRGLGVTAEPLLVAAGPDAVVEASADATLVAVGLSERWSRDGLGATRATVAQRAAAPVALVRRGVRPGAVAPARALTRFRWSAG